VATDQLNHLEDLFKALGDRTRLRILALLASGEVCVCNIHESLNLPQPTVSRHLAYLRRMELVEATRSSRLAHYRLAAPTHQVHANLINCVRSCFTGIGSLDRERTLAKSRVLARASQSR
jgi:ArsR family transcriptional regulator